MADRQVGFVGLGHMGGRMARRLVRAGITVLGYDLRPGLASAAGASPADSPAAVCAGSECVLLSLPDSHVVESVVLGRGGLIGAASPGQVIIDLSTAAPESTRRIHAALAERGVEYLDAGISGGAAAAEKGTLTIMAGGSAAALERSRWVLEPIASKVELMGDSGRFPHIIQGDYLEGGLTSELMTKDVVLYVDHVRSLGVPCLNAAGPLASFGAAINLGYGQQISNRVVDAIGDLAGGVRLHDDDAAGG